MNQKKLKLKVGDILGFELTHEKLVFDKKYGFAKVLAKTKLGDAIEVYNYFSDDIKNYKEALDAKPLFEQPVILDDYSIFWKRSDGKWELLERDENFIYKNSSKIKYKYGVKGLFKLIDLNGEEYENLTQEEIEEYPDYSPYSNYAVLKKIHFLLNKTNK